MARVRFKVKKTKEEKIEKYFWEQWVYGPFVKRLWAGALSVLVLGFMVHLFLLSRSVFFSDLECEWINRYLLNDILWKDFFQNPFSAFLYQIIFSLFGFCSIHYQGLWILFLWGLVYIGFAYQSPINEAFSFLCLLFLSGPVFYQMLTELPSQWCSIIFLGILLVWFSSSAINSLIEQIGFCLLTLVWFWSQCITLNYDLIGKSIVIDRTFYLKIVDSYGVFGFLLIIIFSLMIINTLWNVIQNRSSMKNFLFQIFLLIAWLKLFLSHQLWSHQFVLIIYLIAFSKILNWIHQKFEHPYLSKWALFLLIYIYSMMQMQNINLFRKEDEQMQIYAPLIHIIKEKIYPNSVILVQKAELIKYYTQRKTYKFRNEIWTDSLFESNIGFDSFKNFLKMANIDFWVVDRNESYPKALTNWIEENVQNNKWDLIYDNPVFTIISIHDKS